jgi:methylated-DNA-[protein]-cysteine S-methyltransferase
MTAGFELFDTRIGHCAVAWGQRGIVRLTLPEGDGVAMRVRMQRYHATAREQSAPPQVAAVISEIQRLLAGEDRDLSAIALDMSAVPEFDRRVYVETRSIPPGQTVTYGQIATRLGDSALSRAVGQALGRNPFALIVPCHRVLAAGGKSGGFSAAGGVATKLRLLEIERARGVHPTLPWDQGSN